MKVVVDQKVLAQSLGRILSMASNRGPGKYEPMMLVANEGMEQLELHLSNGEVFALEKVPCSTLVPGSCIVHADHFGNLVKNLTVGEPTHLTVESNILIVRQNRLRYSLKLYAFDSFWRLPPSEEEVEFTPLNPTEFLSCISRVSYASLKSADTTEPTTNVLVEPLMDGAMRAVGVARAQLSSQQGVGVIPMPFQLSHVNISSLRKLFTGKDESMLSVDSRMAHFHTPDGHLKIRLPAKGFPPFSQVFPQKPFRRVLFPQAELEATLKRMRVFGGEDILIEITIDGPLMRVFMLGIGHEDIGVENFSDAPISLKLDSEYFLKMIQSFPEGVLELRFFGEKLPIMVTDNKGATDLLMQKEKA